MREMLRYLKEHAVVATLVAVVLVTPFITSFITGVTMVELMQIMLEKMLGVM